MAATGGSIESLTLDGREFPVAADAEALIDPVTALEAFPGGRIGIRQFPPGFRDH